MATNYGIHKYSMISYGTSGQLLDTATTGYWASFSLATNEPNTLNYVADFSEQGVSGAIRIQAVSALNTASITGSFDQDIRTDSGWKGMGYVTTSDLVLMTEYNSSTMDYFWPVSMVQTLTGSDLSQSMTLIVKHSGAYEPQNIWAHSGLYNSVNPNYFCLRTYHV